MTTPEELAENTGGYLLPRPFYETVVTDDYTYIAGPNNAWVLDIREPNVEWARAESRRRGLPLVEWWVGWSVRPSLATELLSLGLVPDDEPVLTGMTCGTAPPEAPHIEVRAIETAPQYLEAVAVDWDVWQIPEDERARRRATEVDRFDEDQAAGTAHHWAAFVGGRPVGFGRGIDMDDAVALMGGAVLPEARGRGVYRALVRARWDHAAARGTPLLASLVLQRAPNGTPPEIDTVRVETLDEFLTAQEIDLITTGLPQKERERLMAGQSAHWDEQQAEGVIAPFLARVGGRAVAFARSAYGDDGVALLGGGTLEADRGNGYYTALVHARWRDAVERGTPLLCTQAGRHSRPILESLGFERLGEIRVLVDHL